MTPDADAPPPERTDGLRAQASRWITFWILSIGAVALDWWSKSVAVDFHIHNNGLLAESRPAEFFQLGFFNLQIVREYNTGMAFGLLQDTPNSYIYLGIIRAVAVAVLIWVFHRPVRRARLVLWAIGLLAAGAAGNLLDNIFHLEFSHEHSVRDFLLVSIAERSLPAFNLADVYVAIGAILFFLVLSRARVDRR